MTPPMTLTQNLIDQPHTPRHPVNTYWVDPGRLLAGEYPGHMSPETSRQKLMSYLDVGIKESLQNRVRGTGRA